MQKVVLDNGLTVIFERKRGKAVVVELMIKTGSNHESKEERGIAHFLEHILFEGTKKRPTNQIITNEIEKIGGNFNAYTTNERTCFYVKVLNKHFSKAIEIISDIIQNSLFDKDKIEKEKNIVLKEIDMVHDEPRYYQWILLQSTLFKKHPCKFPTYGDKDIIRNLTREEVIGYFNRHYVPSNMVLTIVGDVKDWRKEARKFASIKKGKLKQLPKVKELEPGKTVIRKEKKKIVNTYCVMGFKTVPRDHKDSYVLEVINGILGRGQSGKMFTEIRSERGLAYDVGTQHISEVSFGYFAAYATIDKKNVEKVRKLILFELEKLEKLSEKELKEGKDFIEGDYLLELEDGQKVSDQIVFWEQLRDASMMKDFLKGIKKVTLADVRRVAKKYFKNYTMIVLEGK